LAVARGATPAPLSGELNTVKLFLNQDDLWEQVRRAIVIGLGMVGDLTSGRWRHLRQCCHDMRFAGQRRAAQDHGRRRLHDVCLNISLTSLLIGSGEAGVSVADSLRRCCAVYPRQPSLERSIRRKTIVDTVAKPKTGHHRIHRQD
jgi:hypothetical protein